MVEHHHTRRQILQRAGGAAVGATSLAALLSACGSSDSGGSAAAGTTAAASGSKDAIKVGVLFSLSGNLSIAETSMKNATMLAIDELNARGGVGGRKLQPVVEDYASDFGVVVEKARKLVEQDRVAATIGCYASASRKAVLPVFEQGNAVLLYPTFYEGLECSTNVIYTSLVAAQHLTDTTGWMVKHAGKRIYMVGSDYVGPQTYNAIVKKLAEQQGATVLANRFFPLDQTEFGSALSAIRAAKPDLIWNTIVGAGIPAFLKQYQAAGFTPQQTPIFSGICTEQELAAVGGAAAKGHYFPASYFETIDTPENRSFIGRYQAKYGSAQPTNMPMQASYTSVLLLAAAIEKAGEATPGAILKAFPGVSATAPGEGTVTVKDNHHTTHTVSLGQANDRALYDVVERFAPRDPDPFPAGIVPASKIPTCPRRETT
ncbi:MAG TPA: transporter substrate-binding protein [Conexibacter sp.]|jgi:urea transport system substrate-binding protein|nr:transporter substrate-binding protein [Conexibacter sp.]